MATPLDYYVVIEQTSPVDEKIEILPQNKNNSGMEFLRFTACIQSFIGRNRNRRLWQSRFVKQQLESATTKELLKEGFPGENGHPVPPTGKAEIERILTIDPNNISHIFKKFWFTDNDKKLYAEVETIYDINGPGVRFMYNILQGLNPAFSSRSIVPQSKNPDGSIDVTGPGRLVTFDRVFVPSHEEAYRDVSIPLTKIIKNTSEIGVIMESAVGFIMDYSEKTNRIVDGMYPAMESASYKNGLLTVNTEKEGRVIIPIERNLRNELKSFMKGL